jgi:hypothetical protein
LSSAPAADNPDRLIGGSPAETLEQCDAHVERATDIRRRHRIAV